MNRKGLKPAALNENLDRTDSRIKSDILDAGDLSRFDNKKKKRRKNNNNNYRSRSRGNSGRNSED
ncbi:MAG TPA: hypothetical protein DCW98_04320 [Bacteroidales bacterium]|nr:hypothetical protein [Bacteroidales bacterium]